MIVFGQASPGVGMHIWSRGCKISCVSRRWSHFPCLYGNRFAACSLLTLINSWTLSCSPSACAFVLFLLNHGFHQSHVWVKLKLFFTIERYNWIYYSALWKGTQMVVFWEWQGLGAIWALPKTGWWIRLLEGVLHVPCIHDILYNWSQWDFCQAAKSSAGLEISSGREPLVNFHAKKSWGIYAVLG